MNKFIKAIAVSLATVMVAGAVQFIVPSNDVKADIVYWTHEADPEKTGDYWSWYVDNEGIKWLSLETSDYLRYQTDNGVENPKLCLPDSTYKPADYEGNPYFKLELNSYTAQIPLTMSSGTVTIDLNGNDIFLGNDSGVLNLTGTAKYVFINTSDSPASIRCGSKIYERNGDGGLISVSAGATLTIDNVDLSRGSAANGGAISAIDGANVTLSNCSITECYASGYGSAVYAAGSSTVTMNNVTITGNTGESFDARGALYAGGNSLTLGGKMIIADNDNWYDEGENLWIAGNNPVFVSSNSTDTDVKLTCADMSEGKQALIAQNSASLTGYTCDEFLLFRIDSSGKIQAVVDYGTATLDGMQLVLEGSSVKIFFYITLSEEAYERSWDILIDSKSPSLSDGEGPRQFIAKKVIDYSHLTDEINISVLVNDVEIFEQPKTPITAQSYAQAILSGSEYSQDAKNVAKAMLNYGTYAQGYFDVNVTNPANSVLTESQKAEAFLDESVYKALTSSMEITETSTDVTYYGTSLRMENDGTLTMKHYIKVADGFTTQLGFLYYGKVRNLDTNANPKFFSLTEDGNFGIHQLNTTVNLTICDTDKNEYVTIKYSGLDYVYMAYNYGTPELQEYVKALYKYYTVLSSVGGGVL